MNRTAPKPWTETRSLPALIEGQRVTHRMAMRCAYQSETHAAQCFWLKQAGIARRTIMFYMGKGAHPYEGRAL